MPLSKESRKILNDIEKLQQYLTKPEVRKARVELNKLAIIAISKMMAQKEQETKEAVIKERDANLEQAISQISLALSENEEEEIKKEYEKKNEESLERILKEAKENTSNEMYKIKTQYMSPWMKALEERFSEFKERHPSIYNLITELDDPYTFDMNRLMQMLQLKDAIAEQQITVEAASERIGQQYFDEFVKPVVGEDAPKKQ